MTREEAAKNPVDLAIWEFENAIKGTEEDNSEYPNYCIHIDEYKTALKALLWMKGPRPDPDTGLVPCGCGGKAKVWPSNLRESMITGYAVVCTECDMAMFWVRGKKENAVKVWNRAMGWKGGPEPGGEGEG